MAKSTLWSEALPPTDNAIPTTPPAPTMPDPAGVAKVMPDLTKTIAQTADSPRYAALKGGSTEQPTYDTRKAIISSFPGISQLLGAKPEEVSEAKQWREANDAANLANAEKVISENKPYGNAVSATQGLVSGATMGAPEALQKMLGPGYGQETTQQVKEQYPVANIAGNVAGALGSSLAVPGAGTALAAKGGMLAGKGLAPLIAKEALNAATFAIPTAVTQGIASGDPGATWHDLKQNMLYGTIGGVAIGKILGGAPKVAKAMEEVADDMAMHSAGINPKILKSIGSGGVAGKSGGTAEHLAQLRSDVSDMITKNGLHSKADIQQFVKGEGKIWNQVDDAFKASGSKPSDFIDEITKHPDIAKLVNDPQYGGEVNTYIQNVLKRGDALVDYAAKSGGKALPDIRKILSTDMRNGFKSSDIGTQLKGDVADAIHDVIDGHFVPVELKKAWPALKMLKLGSERLESMVKGVEAGSPTAPRMILERMLGGGEGGAMLGAGASMRDFDPSDPSSWAKLGINMTIGTVAGSMANKGLARLTNRIGGQTAGVLKKVSGALGSIPAGGEAIGEKAAQFLGSGQPEKLTAGGAPLMAPIEQPPAIQAGMQPIVDGVPQIIPVGQPAGTQPIPNAPVNPMEQANNAFKVAAQEPDAPVGHWNPTFVDDRIQRMYSKYTRQFGADLSPQEFKEQVLKGTNNLDPDSFDTWVGMFDNPKTAEKMYADYKALSRLPLNAPKDTFTPQALNHYLRIFPTRKKISRFTPEARLEEEQANYTLVQTLSDLTKQTPAEIDRKLRMIAFSHIKPEAKKQAVMDMIVKEGKVDIAALHRTGLW